MAKQCPEIGLSNVQAAWVELEDVRDVLQKPTAAGYIRPRGNISMSQTPSRSNSEELSESLNISAQFQNAVDVGQAQIGTYLRLASDGSRMQGHALLVSAMGGFQEKDRVTCKLSAALDAKADNFMVKGVAGGIFPPRCIIQIENEKILVGGVDKANGVVIGTYNCVRGYAGTTAASHSADAEITVKSPVYYQDVCRETVSLWVKMDHVVLWGRGGVVTAVEIPMSNTGGQNINYTINFKQLGWAGTAIISGAPNGKTVTVETMNGANAAYGYCVGSYIKNTTKDDDNNGAGYRITGVDVDKGTITIDGTITSWAAGDKLDAWTPKSESIGEPVEARTALVFIDGHAGGIREGSFTMNTPAEQKLLVGDVYPSYTVDTQRDVSISMDTYFTRGAASAIGRGYVGYETSVALVFGAKAGNRLNVMLPRVKMNTPEIGVDGAALTLNRTGAVLGKDYEDSVYFSME